MSEEQESAFRYRHRAEEVREIAESTTDPNIRSILVRVADDYEKMAQTLEQMARRQNPNDRK